MVKGYPYTADESARTYTAFACESVSVRGKGEWDTHTCKESGDRVDLYTVRGDGGRGTHGKGERGTRGKGERDTRTRATSLRT